MVRPTSQLQLPSLYILNVEASDDPSETDRLGERATPGRWSCGRRRLSGATQSRPRRREPTYLIPVRTVQCFLDHDDKAGRPNSPPPPCFQDRLPMSCPTPLACRLLYGRLSGSIEVVGTSVWREDTHMEILLPSVFRARETLMGRWVYDYVGYLVPIWPNGVDKRAAIVGSVIRTVPHNNGQARAGYVASFIAVKQVYA